MNSRIVIAASCAAVMGSACLAPVASQAQTSQPSGFAQSVPNTLSEGSALPAPKVDPSKVKKSSIAPSAEQTASKTGELVLQPAPKR
jgi:hypothetical protein